MDDKERQLMQMAGQAINLFGFTKYSELANHFGWSYARSKNIIRMMADLHLVRIDEDTNHYTINMDMWKVWESYRFSKNFMAYYKSDEIKKKRMKKGIPTEAQTFLESFQTFSKPVDDFNKEMDDEDCKNQFEGSYVVYDKG